MPKKLYSMFDLEMEGMGLLRQMFSIEEFLDGRSVIIYDRRRVENFFNSRDKLGTLDGYLNMIRNYDAKEGRESGKAVHRYLISYRFPKVQKALKRVSESECPEYSGAIDEIFSKVSRSDYDSIIKEGFYESLSPRIFME